MYSARSEFLIKFLEMKFNYKKCKKVLGKTLKEHVKYMVNLFFAED